MPKRPAKRVAVIDAETDPFKHGRLPEPFAWGFFDGVDFRSWWNDQAGFVEHLKTCEAIVYAHNGGKFDFHFLANDFDTERAPSIINGRLVKVYVGSAELRDSWCILPMPLAEYQKDAIDYSWFEADEREQHREAILAYLETDCRFLHELVSTFLAENPGHPLTIAQAAMRHLKSIVGNVPTSGEAFDTMLRPWYFGGRCEVFKRGTARVDFQVLDINSAYPWAMMSPHPWGTSYTTSRYLPDHSDDLRASFAEIDAISIGALPRRAEDGSLSFPHDVEPCRYFASGHEIEAGLELGTLEIHDVHWVHTFLERLSFAPYVDRFYTMKREAKARGDKRQEIVAKYLLNGLYGKFAQRGDLQYDWYWSTSPQPDPLADMIYKVGPYDLLGYSKMGRFYNVATAASITAQVRAHLWRAIRNSTGVIYVDTDSIAAVETDLPIGTGLGEWKVEASCDAYHVGGKKLYAFRTTAGDWKTASKGVRLTVQEIARVARGEVVDFRSDAPTISVAAAPRFITRRIRRT